METLETRANPSRRRSEKGKKERKKRVSGIGTTRRNAHTSRKGRTRRSTNSWISGNTWNHRVSLLFEVKTSDMVLETNEHG